MSYRASLDRPRVDIDATRVEIKRWRRMTSNAPFRPGAGRDFSLLAVVLTAMLQILTPLLPMVGIGEPIGGQSNAVRTLITPAGWAFSIWGALYTGAIAFAIFQALPSQRTNSLLRAIRWPAAGAFMGNALWAAYTQIYGLNFFSVLIILGSLACLIIIYRNLSRRDYTPGERWCVYLPLSALAAWLTVATTVNIAASLRFHGIEGGAYSPIIGAAVVVTAGMIAVAALVRGQGNPPYAIRHCVFMGADRNLCCGRTTTWFDRSEYDHRRSSGCWRLHCWSSI